MLPAEVLATKERALMKPVTGFITEDGTFFQTEHEAYAHESMKDQIVIIDNFLSSTANPYPSGTHKGMIKNSILGWEMWKGKQNAK